MVKRRVCVWLDFVPEGSGSGADLRFYSNLQAFLDLGFLVELVVVSAAVPRRHPRGPMAKLPVRYVRLSADDSGIASRLAYRAGLPVRAGFEYAFPGHAQIVAELQRGIAQDPELLHFIEGEHLTSALPFVKSSRLIWSYHDSPSQVALASARIAAGIERRGLHRAEKRAVRFAARAETRMLRSAPLVLTISDTDRARIAGEHLAPVATLPMSVPDEDPYRLNAGFPVAPDPLRLLHLGRTAHLPSYRSLEMLLEQVLPALPQEVLERIELFVAGSHEGEDSRSRRIRELAARYQRQVRLLGFVDDLKDLVRKVHVQVVATPETTGLRTRIIESFACGLPVLSTRRGAAGILGMKHGGNIVLAETPAEFAEAIVRLASGQEKLRSLAEGGCALYQARYSRRVVAQRLEEILREHKLLS